MLRGVSAGTTDWLRAKQLGFHGGNRARAACSDHYVRRAPAFGMRSGAKVPALIVTAIVLLRERSFLLLCEECEPPADAHQTLPRLPI